MRRLALPALALFTLLAGCHSRMVVATLHNGSVDTLRLVELDYPSASFGTQSLAPGADFRYRFKVLGSGPLKLTFTGRDGKERTVTGPELQEGAEGQLRVEISASGVAWKPMVTAP